MRAAIYLTKRRDYDRALADFNEAIRLDPNAADRMLPTLYFGRGKIYLDTSFQEKMY